MKQGTTILTLDNGYHTLDQHPRDR
ncbi:Protein of unknown function [Lactobacillus delbrueckii subsp. lactis]|nr:Protein of unknown function [Lactobacillus delbrueckii subsp. lactis]